MSGARPAAKPGTYSSWNWRTGEYDYYTAVLKTVGYGDQVSHPAARAIDNPVGETPEQSANPLPGGARKIGSGEMAMGEIVDPHSVGSGLQAWGQVALAILIPTALLWVTANLGRIFKKGA